MNKRPKIGQRERKRQATRLLLQRCALELFAKNGYDETTVEQIAAAADVSAMTFFRYFPSKADALTSDYKWLVASSFAALPTGGTIVERMKIVAITIMAPLYEQHKDSLLTILELTVHSSRVRALAAANRHSMVQDILAMLGLDESDKATYFTNLGVVSACLALIESASLSWASQKGHTPIAVLLENAFDTLESEFRSVQ